MLENHKFFPLILYFRKKKERVGSLAQTSDLARQMILLPTILFQFLLCLVSFEFSLQFMPVTRSANQSHQVQVDLKIENTLRRL